MVHKSLPNSKNMYYNMLVFPENINVIKPAPKSTSVAKHGRNSRSKHDDDTKARYLTEFSRGLHLRSIDYWCSSRIQYIIAY